MTKEKHLQYVNKINEIYQNFESRKVDYEESAEAVTKIHNVYLHEFKKSMVGEGLSPKAIQRYFNCADFFFNVYLTRELQSTFYNCANDIPDFFGYFYIRKCLFASMNNLNQFITALKKFYKFLYLSGYIDVEVCADAYTYIKNLKDERIEELTDYYNGEEEEWW